MRLVGVIKMERVSLVVDVYNFLLSSKQYLGQQCYVDCSKMHKYFIDPSTQVWHKTYLYGGASLGKLMNYFKSQPRVDVILGETNVAGKEKCTDINLAIGMLTKAFYNTYDVALLFSGDKDYLKLVRELKRMGKIVGCVTPAGTPAKNARSLAVHCDFHIELDESFYEAYWSEKQPPYVSCINNIEMNDDDELVSDNLTDGNIDKLESCK